MGMFDVNRRGGGMSPLALAVFGTLAYKALKGRGGLGGLLGARPETGNPTGSAANLGGVGAGGLGAGLRDLLDRFRQTGHEDKAQSWVSTGANRPIAAHELEQVLGPERIDWLMQQTGLPKDQLLAGLSTELPGTIDKLTPKGQVPTDDELDREIQH